MPSNNRGEKDVEVRVTNVDEPGTVTLSALQARVGVPLTAKLTDPDGGVHNVDVAVVQMGPRLTTSLTPRRTHTSQLPGTVDRNADGYGDLRRR